VTAVGKHCLSHWLQINTSTCWSTSLAPLVVGIFMRGRMGGMNPDQHLDPITLTILLVFSTTVCLILLKRGWVKPTGAVERYYRDKNPIKYWLYTGVILLCTAMF